MSDISIAEAKARFAELVHEAETGTPVRITRRGKPVAVLMAEADFARLQIPEMGWAAFSQAWRDQMTAEALPLLSEAELEGLRDRSERSALEL
ncbi:type II toxin-antitoxin system Phd/YefM family antitoxin [Ideonella sp.]|uniref:type II toxin-antitoxin system Phd/YefM family antitoxin n=1 Tax=Ideonella sp. TaxID=1929293 RepID=UPI003BB60BDF